MYPGDVEQLLIPPAEKEIKYIIRAHRLNYSMLLIVILLGAEDLSIGVCTDDDEDSSACGIALWNNEVFRLCHGTYCFTILS